MNQFVLRKPGLKTYCLALITILFGALVGLGNVLLVDHNSHHVHHDHSIDTTQLNCVFCLEGVTPTSVRLFFSQAVVTNTTHAHTLPLVYIYAVSHISLYGARAPPN